VHRRVRGRARELTAGITRHHQELDRLPPFVTGMPPTTRCNTIGPYCLASRTSAIGWSGVRNRHRPGALTSSRVCTPGSCISDRVGAGGQGGNGNYIPGTDIAFWVDRLPFDQTLSPWTGFAKVPGGSVRLKRIT
jgi:hypothetical protein